MIKINFDRLLLRISRLLHRVDFLFTFLNIFNLLDFEGEWEVDPTVFVKTNEGEGKVGVLRLSLSSQFMLGNL